MKNKATQIYGYVVCVVAVVTFLITAANLVNSIIDRSDPLYAGFSRDNNLASFENYKVEAMKDIVENAAYIPDDATLKTMYEAAKEDTIARAMHQTKRNMIVSGIVMVIAIVLFYTHWMWIVAPISKSGEKDE